MYTRDDNDDIAADIQLVIIVVWLQNTIRRERARGFFSFFRFHSPNGYMTPRTAEQESREESEMYMAGRAHYIAA